LLLAIIACGDSTSGSASDGGADAPEAGSDVGVPDDGGADVSDAPAGDGADAAQPEGPNVLTHHKHASRDGVFVDSAFTKDAIRRTARDLSFAPTIDGAVFAQPLFVEAGVGGKDALIVATEKNHVYALDAASGVALWDKPLGAPVPLSALPCGNIDPLGVTSTPTIDLASRTLFVEAAVSAPAPDGGTAVKHLVFALSLDDGGTRAGWPVDLAAALGDFDPAIHNQRGALLLSGGSLYVPFGGLAGDCLSYRGRVVAISTANASSVREFVTASSKAGIWAPSGVTSDGTSIFVTTGNGEGEGTTWQNGEAVLRLSGAPAFSGQTRDFFTPSNWVTLDQLDLDMSGVAPLPVDLPGSRLIVALGKNGVAYVLDRDDLGGIGKGDGGSGEGLFSLTVADGPIIGAPAVARAGSRVFVVFKGYFVGGAGGADVLGVGCPPGQSGGLVGLELVAGAPPSLRVAWCQRLRGSGGLMITTPDGASDPVAWAADAEYTSKLMAYDAATGEVLFDSSADAQALNVVRRFVPPIAAKGRVFVPADGTVHAFALR
jgi:outer membrane protein assembly factor BamB